MASIKLQPHSCSHCQRLIFNEYQRSSAPRDGERKNFVHYDFRPADIIAGDSDSCSLCSWLLDEEWVSRGAMTDNRHRNIDPYPGFENVMAAVINASIRMDDWLPAPNPTNTLRQLIASNNAENMAHMTLAHFCNDMMVIKFFGLWDNQAGRMMYRSRGGFSFYALPDDPAARVVTTRPIEQETAGESIIAQATAWLEECLRGKSGGSRIHRNCPVPRSDYMPTRLIKITNDQGNFKLKVCEMKGQTAESYVALSYCWGGDQEIKSTTALLPMWTTSIPWDKLPQTLRDAVIVCDKLRVRYLWVDALCIVQDDANHMAKEIAAMPDVYQNSAFTIAASSASNVRQGFLAKRRGADDPTSIFQLRYQVESPQEVGSVILIRAKIDPEPLDTRAWALQERLLSPRTIEFGTRQLRCFCQHSTRGITDGWRQAPEANEARQDQLEDVSILQAQFDAIQAPTNSDRQLNPDNATKNWYRLVKVYSNRALTKPEDRILAISGIAERYGRVFGDQYCAGMWRSTFANALYWKPSYHAGPQPRPTKWQGPSWSWMSVNAPVDFPHLIGSDREHNPIIMAVDTKLVNPDDPYGAVQEGSCQLIVKARLSPAVLRFETDIDGKLTARAGSISMGGKADVFEIPISYDAVEPEPERVENNAVFLELSSVLGDNGWSTRGLIARGKGGTNIFSRIGTFDYSGWHNRQRQENESVEDWKRRARYELCWFDGNPEKDYVII